MDLETRRVLSHELGHVAGLWVHLAQVPERLVLDVHQHSEGWRGRTLFRLPPSEDLPDVALEWQRYLYEVEHMSERRSRAVIARVGSMVAGEPWTGEAAAPDRREVEALCPAGYIPQVWSQETEQGAEALAASDSFRLAHGRLLIAFADRVGRERVEIPEAELRSALNAKATVDA
jgi:hypothetical protein